MRRGNTPTINLDQHGEIVAISTGSDFCSEHEGGSETMLSTLCSGHAAAGGEADAKLISILRDGGVPDFPRLIDRKAMDRNLDHLSFTESRDGRVNKATATITFHSSNRTPNIDNPELSLRNDGGQLAGAWDNRSFAFKVAGDELVNKLRRFYDQLLAGDGIFAGTFLINDAASGVVVALQRKLGPGDLLNIEEAQSKWESDLLLRAKSRLEDLNDLFSRKSVHPFARSPGYIWPVWRDYIVGGEVVYGLNPTNDRVGPYFGPYEFDQLRDWILAETKTKLVPSPGRPRRVAVIDGSNQTGSAVIAPQIVAAKRRAP